MMRRSRRPDVRSPGSSEHEEVDRSEYGDDQEEAGGDKPAVAGAVLATGKDLGDASVRLLQHAAITSRTASAPACGASRRLRSVGAPSASPRYALAPAVAFRHRRPSPLRAFPNRRIPADASG